MDYVKSQYQLVETILNELKQNYKTIEIEEYQRTLEKLKMLLGSNPIVILHEALLYVRLKDLKTAKSLLLKHTNIFNFNLDLYLLLIDIVAEEQDCDIQYLFSIMKRAYNGAVTNKESTKTLIERVKFYANKLTNDDNGQQIDILVEELINIKNYNGYRNYPHHTDNSNLIKKRILSERTSDHYFINMYKNVYYSSFTNDDDRFLLIYEQLKGTYESHQKALELNENDIIAFTPVKSGGEVSFELNKKSRKYTIYPNHRKYFKFKEKGVLKLDFSNEYFISHFKHCHLNNKPKLVLFIFIDGLSYKFFKDKNIKDIMPNTWSFFEKGYINENFHANSEWTLPSFMSIASGKYTANHHLFHTDRDFEPENINKFIQEYFYDEGYNTAYIDNNWRITPTYGYYKKTNRFLYSPMLERMHCNEMISETLEHIEAFKDFCNFVSLTIEDLHSVSDEFDRGILSDVLSKPIFEHASTENDSDISVFKHYDPQKISNYCGMMKKIDLHLESIYHYIQNQYKDDEFVIILNSDHGQSYFTDDEFMFSNLRTNVPLMVRGKNVPQMISSELASNVDILPTILNLCDINCIEKIDGLLPKDFGGSGRNFTYTESIFPYQTYKAAINDLEHLFYFESEKFVEHDGMVNILPYSTKLINRITNKDESGLYREKIDKYTKEVFEHIKEWIKF